MTAPTVSVVMCVFNGERFLHEAAESILAQSFRDFEFIVIDDGSSDSTPLILDAFAGRDARLKVHHEPHLGLIASLNKGCGLARGEYIARMDADDIAKPDRLALQMEFMKGHPDIGVLGGAVELMDSDGRTIACSQNPPEDAEIRKALQHRCPLWHPTVVFRREVFAQAGGYRSVVDAEDYDFWLRVAERFQMANLSSVLLQYRLHPGQTSLQGRVRQSLGMLAARAAADKRSRNLPDPLNEPRDLTPELLVEWGIPLREQRRKIISDYLIWIRNMSMADEHAAALGAAHDLLKAGANEMSRAERADLHMLIANLFCRMQCYSSGAISTGRAISARPTIMARAVKRLLGAIIRNRGIQRKSRIERVAG
ncbi:MAG: glycosyltransferase [Terracidiphilus sp.]